MFSAGAIKLSRPLHSALEKRIRHGPDRFDTVHLRGCFCMLMRYNRPLSFIFGIGSALDSPREPVGSDSLRVGCADKPGELRSEGDVLDVQGKTLMPARNGLHLFGTTTDSSSCSQPTQLAIYTERTLRMLSFCWQWALDTGFWVPTGSISCITVRSDPFSAYPTVMH